MKVKVGDVVGSLTVAAVWRGARSKLFADFTCVCGERVRRRSDGLTQSASCGCRGTMFVGAKHGLLTIIEPLPDRRVRCRCDCGNETIAWRMNIISGNTTSCGCVKQAMYRSGRAALTHGHATTGKISRAYRCWVNMLSRCYTRSSSSWDYYGGLGVAVCDRWRHSFENFLADMGEPPEGMSLDRYPRNDGNYEPGNCRWATSVEQNNNRRPRGTVKRVA